MCSLFFIGTKGKSDFSTFAIIFGCGLKKIVYFAFMQKKFRGSLKKADKVFLWSSEAETFLVFNSVISDI